MKILFPIVLTLIAAGMLMNFMSTGVGFSVTLFSFGFASGIAVAYWANFFNDK